MIIDISTHAIAGMQRTMDSGLKGKGGGGVEGRRKSHATREYIFMIKCLDSA